MKKKNIKFVITGILIMVFGFLTLVYGIVDNYTNVLEKKHFFEVPGIYELELSEEGMYSIYYDNNIITDSGVDNTERIIPKNILIEITEEENGNYIDIIDYHRSNKPEIIRYNTGDVSIDLVEVHSFGVLNPLVIQINAHNISEDTNSIICIKKSFSFNPTTITIVYLLLFLTFQVIGIVLIIMGVAMGIRNRKNKSSS